jgi:hypothetical protein
VASSIGPAGMCLKPSSNLFVAGDLGLELGKTLKLEWHKASNQRTRCLRITAKEEKAVRGKLQVRFLFNCSFI